MTRLAYDSNLMRTFAIYTLGLAAASSLLFVQHCEAAAQLLRVPLERATTQQAGQFDQPVINYFAPIQIGSPPVNFKIQFDTGLQEHFVPHYLWNPFNRNLHYSNGFRCKSSSTCKKDDRTLTFDYQNCRLTGKRYEDFIALANVQTGPTNTNLSRLDGGQISRPVHWVQNFLAISSAGDARFAQLPIDGFFGLGPLPESHMRLENLLISLHNAKFIDNLQFSLWFNPVLDSAQGGELILGGVDPARYQGQIYWHRLEPTNYKYWQLNLQYVMLGNQHISCASPSPVGCQAKFSSGLSDTYGPREDVLKIYNLLNTSYQSNGLQLIDCRRINNLPVLTFMIDGISYSLLPSNYIRKTIDGVIFKKETCYVAILPASSSIEWTLGTNFLGAYYSIFDMTNRQIGFAAMR